LKKKKILIAGGTGFIGYHVSKRFVNLGFDVTSLSSKQPSKKRFINKVNYLICDLTNKKKISKAIIEDFEIIINLSGYVDHSNKKKTFKTHYYGCKNLANIFLNKKIKCFIQLGSSMEYGNILPPHFEKNICKPRTSYALAKYKSTKYLKYLNLKYKFPVVVLRLYQAYGPKQEINRLVPIVINSCLKSKTFPCTKGDQLRDFLYIDDLVNLMVKIIKKKDINYQIFNVGSGKSIKIKSLINLIKKMSKKGQPQFGKIKMRKEEPLELFPNINKVKKYFNWKPKITIEKGIRKTITSYEK
jgi:UDP-glucose 4-epimerase